MADPTDAQDAETKAHVAATFVPLAGDVTMTGTLGGDDGVADTDFVTKAQLDAVEAAASGFPSIKEFKTAGTDYWTVPVGVTTVKAHAIGPGGGGGAFQYNAGGGGGYAYSVLFVTPGEQLTAVVGIGGAATGADGSEATELRRLATVLLSAGAGKGTNNGGAGGVATVGTLVLTGENGDYAYNTGSGGDAAGPFGGKGGMSGIIGIPGRPGQYPGGGGGGPGSSAAGAAGAAGAIIIEY